jgi:hypothetical protein
MSQGKMQVQVQVHKLHPNKAEQDNKKGVTYNFKHNNSKITDIYYHSKVEKLIDAIYN